MMLIVCSVGFWVMSSTILCTHTVVLGFTFVSHVATRVALHRSRNSPFPVI